MRLAKSPLGLQGHLDIPRNSEARRSELQQRGGKRKEVSPGKDFETPELTLKSPHTGQETPPPHQNQGLFSTSFSILLGLIKSI